MHHKIAIRVDPEDNVLVALTDIKCSTEIEPGLITKELIPAKQKLAGRDFNDGNDITMYGVVVGSTKKTIRSGELISTENVAHKSSPYEGYVKPTPSFRLSTAKIVAQPSVVYVCRSLLRGSRNSGQAHLLANR